MVLLLAIACFSNFMLGGAHQTGQCNRMDDKLEKETDSNGLCTSSSALAVVPYTEEGRLPHQLSFRNFHLAGHDLHIEQDWSNHGVAAVVWDAAIVLGEYLERNSHVVRDQKVIELGAGTGVAGMVAAFLGGHVTVTERKDAMTHLEKTVKSNMADLSNMRFMELDWTDHRTARLGDYDVVLGADIVYIEDTFNDLLQTILKLTGDNTQVLLSCRIRYQRDNNFLDLLKKHLDVTEVFYDKSRDIKIYSAKRILSNG